MIINVFTQILLTLLVCFIILTDASPPSAQTQQGVYIGRQTKVNDTNVNFWLGIPYAQQPVGNLRWKPPQPLSVGNETSFAYTANACPQGHNFEPPFTEACLSLNVYTPANETNLPVFIWIHGGSFTVGAGMVYNATPFVATTAIHSRPIIIVTINYRLGFLGFLADQALYDEKSGVNNRSTTGTYGILDQMMALDWIKENIRGFGGDPEQITIGGESAGGVSITMLLTSPLVKNNTVQRAIIQSGNLWPSFSSSLQDAINNSGNILRTAINCTTTTADCLRNLNVQQILTVQNIVASKSIVTMAASPAIDGYALDDTMENNIAKGNFKRVPVLVGSTGNETSIFTCRIFNDTATISQVEAFFNRIYNATIIDKIPDVYGPISTVDNPLSYLNNVYSDSWAHCGARRLAAKFSHYNLSTYFFTYNHPLRVLPPCYSAFHGGDVLMFFLSFLDGSGLNVNFTREEQQLSTNMMLYWANFIYSSNPNFQGSLTYWDAFSITADNDLVLDIEPYRRNHYYNRSCSNLWDLYRVKYE